MDGQRLWWKVWWMNRLAEMLSIVTTDLDGFSLANSPNFCPRQTFPPYGKPLEHKL